MSTPANRHGRLLTVVGLVVVLGGYAIIGYAVISVLGGAVPKEGLLFLGAAIGHLVTLAGVVVNWLFGSTRSSAHQTELIHQALAATPPAATPPAA